MLVRCESDGTHKLKPREGTNHLSSIRHFISPTLREHPPDDDAQSSTPDATPHSQKSRALLGKAVRKREKGNNTKETREKTLDDETSMWF